MVYSLLLPPSLFYASGAVAGASMGLPAFFVASGAEAGSLSPTASFLAIIAAGKIISSPSHLDASLLAPASGAGASSGLSVGLGA